MAKFNSDYQPNKRNPRGKSKRTLILDAIRDGAMIGFKEDESLSVHENRSMAEQHLFSHVASRAFDFSDEHNSACLKLLMDKGWANVKPSSELIEFEFNASAKPHEQASQALDAAAKGLIPTDIANTFISSIASVMKIEEVTEMAAKLEEIERSLGIDNG